VLLCCIAIRFDVLSVCSVDLSYSLCAVTREEGFEAIFLNVEIKKEMLIYKVNSQFTDVKYVLI